MKRFLVFTVEVPPDFTETDMWRARVAGHNLLLSKPAPLGFESESVGSAVAECDSWNYLMFSLPCSSASAPPGIVEAAGEPVA